MTTVRLRPAHLLAVAAAALVAASPAQAIEAETLGRALAREAQSAGAYSGAYARDLTGARDLVAVRADTARIPASVEKLFVTSAALLRFGAAAQLSTRVVTSTALDPSGTLGGDVVLVGGGDPTLSDDGLRSLAASLRASGVRRIEGAVVGDESRFDARRGGPRTRFAPDWDIGGRLGALVLRRGFQTDPAAFAAARLRSMLAASGVRVVGGARSGIATGDETVELAALPSPSIGELIRRTNVPSDNFYAEMLLKGLGAQFAGTGSTRSGAAVVRSTLGDAGVRPRIVDGSGLSRANRTTPREVVRLLEWMDGQGDARTWRRSLAVTGRDGTVHRRMRGTAAAGRCRVKTGTLRAVSNLAGVCTTTGGERVAFAWLMNGANTYAARRIQDRMTAMLARYDAGEPTKPKGAWHL